MQVRVLSLYMPLDILLPYSRLFANISTKFAAWYRAIVDFGTMPDSMCGCVPFHFLLFCRSILTARFWASVWQDVRIKMAPEKRQALNYLRLWHMNLLDR